MKAVGKLVILVSLAVLGSVAASANTIEQSYLESCRKDPGVPVPISVVSPAVSAEYSGSSLELEFVVDQDGKPTKMTVKSAPDDTVATAVMDAVKQWRFRPAERNGTRVATKVVLPVNIVAPSDTSPFYAAN